MSVKYVMVFFTGMTRLCHCISDNNVQPCKSFKNQYNYLGVFNIIHTVGGSSIAISS